MSPLPLQDRHAFVTGAGSGIGLAVAQELARLGATLTLAGRDALRLQQAASTLPASAQAACVVLDVTDSKQVSRRFADLPQPVDILVNNAGQAQSSPVARTSDELWNAMLAVNLSGSFHCLRAVLPAMMAQGWGRVVNVSSTAGLTGYAYVAAYCAAKHGVVGLTRSAALEAAAHGVTVNAVCPGYTDTGLLERAVDNIAAKTGRSVEASRRELAARNPQQRLVSPEEVASTVGWLCLPSSSAINGQSIAVAGGEIM